jgi:uncharacterized protein (UPF0216 family)
MYSSKSALDRAFDALLGREIRNLNMHLPKERKSLSELLKLNDPSVAAVDGTSILMKTSELQELAKIVPREFQDRLKLPLVVLRRMDLGNSIYTVSGDRVEEFTVQTILGMTDGDYYQIFAYRQRDPAYLYRPHLSELIRRFHSLVVIGFGLPRELADYGTIRD